MRMVKTAAVPKDEAEETSKRDIASSIKISITRETAMLTNKESLSPTSTNLRAPATGLGCISFVDKENRYPFPKGFIFEEGLHLITRHKRPDTVKPLTFIALAMVLYVSYYYQYISTRLSNLFSLVNHLSGNFMANTANYSLLMRAYLLNHSKELFVAKPSSQEIIMPSNSANLSTMISRETDKAVVEHHRSQHDFFSYIITAKNYGVRRVRASYLFLNRYIYKPIAVLSKNLTLSNLTLSYILILRYMKSTPNAASDFINRNLKRELSNLGVSLFNLNGIEPKNHWIMLIFNFAFELSQKSIGLLGRSSGIKFMWLTVQSKLKIIEFFLNKRFFDSGQIGKFSFDGFLDLHSFTEARNILSEIETISMSFDLPIKIGELSNHDFCKI